ncbi:MAG: PorP/SprF family type IX secretion system membrane protein [Bacteroidota bacterium]
MLLALGLTPLLQAQEEPLFAQYRTNSFLINPGVAGTSETHEIRLTHRAQWMNFPGAPRTSVLSYQGFVDEKNSIGLVAFRDAIGPSVRTGAQAAYGFRFPVGYEGKIGQNYLSLGMAAKFMQYRFRTNRVYFEDPNDVVAQAASAGILQGDLSFGMYFYNDRLYAGISAPNLIRSDLNALSGVTSPDILSRLYRYYFGLVGYKFSYDNMSIEPSILVKKVDSAPYQIEGTVRFHLAEERFLVGFSYRTDWLGSVQLGLKQGNMSFYYSADLMMAQKNNRVYGPSHEFVLGLNLGQRDNWKDSYFIED